MFEAKEKFLDRVEQSFAIFKNNIVLLAVPFIIFNFLTLVVLPVVIMILTLNTLSFDRIVWWDYSQLSNSIMLLVTGGIFFATLYLILLIPVQIWTIKSIKQAIDNKTPSPKENILYGFSHLWEIFRTYWYIFAYVMLIPALIFILGGFSIIWWLAGWWDFSGGFMIVWYICIVFSVLLWGFFAIYRWNRSTFAIISALDSSSFTKENFKNAVTLTQGKWWRVFWNLFGVWLIGWLLIGLVTGVVNAFMGLWSNSWDILSTAAQNEDWALILESLTQFNIFSFIANTFWNILGTLLWVFITTFTYIFFLRLEMESWIKKSQQGIKKEEKLLIEEEL